MHRIPSVNGGTRQSQFLRWSRAVSYLLMGTAGVLLILSPLRIEIYGVISTVMVWFLVIGGYLSSFGAATYRWVGEFTGLPLLSTSFTVLGALSVHNSFSVAPYIAVANFLLLAAISGLLLTRWRYVLAIYRLAEHFGKSGSR